jgi:hypothetical protein
VAAGHLPIPQAKKMTPGSFCGDRPGLQRWVWLRGWLTCSETVDSAIAVAPPPPTQIARPQPVSQINVTTTSASHGLCDPPPHATPTWSRSRAHRRRHARLRPPSPPPSSTSLQVDVVTAAGCYRSGDTPGGVEAGPARPMAAPPGRHVTVLADRSVGSAACRRRSTSPPPAASSCSTASPYCRIRA